jgi:transposase
MPSLNEAQRKNAIGRLKAGESQTAVVRVFNVSQTTISRRWDRCQQNGSTRYLPRSGRPRVTTAAQDRYIQLRYLREQFTTATSTASAIPGVRRISDQTVGNLLQHAGIRAKCLVKAVVLNQQHSQNRLQWAPTHRVWPQQRWRTVWFSDESRFPLQRADGRARVYKRRNERFAVSCIQESDKFVAVVWWCEERYLTLGGLNWCMSTAHWRHNGTVMKFCNTMVFLLCRWMADCSSMTTLGHILQGWQLPIYRTTKFRYMYFLCHPNRQIWTQWKTFGMNWIDASENDNRHRNRYNTF